MDVINKITESASDCTSTVLSWFDEETVGREVAARNKWVAIAAGVGAAYIALRLAASSQRSRFQGRRAAEHVEKVKIQISPENLAYLKKYAAVYQRDVSSTLQFALDYVIIELKLTAEQAKAASSTVGEAQVVATETSIVLSQLRWLTRLFDSDDVSAAVNKALIVAQRGDASQVFGIDRTPYREQEDHTRFHLKS